MTSRRTNLVAIGAVAALVLAFVWAVFLRRADALILPGQGLTLQAGDPPSASRADERPPADGPSRTIAAAQAVVVADPCVEILVLDGDHHPVAGARLTLGIASPGGWRAIAEARTDTEGLAVLARPSASADLAVFAPGKGATFESAVAGPHVERVTVLLPHGCELRGRVTSASGVAVEGLPLQLVGRVGRALAMPEFVLDSELPEVGRSLAPPSDALYVQEAKTESDGSFRFAGIGFDWRVAIVVVDDRWILNPAVAQVEDLAQFLELEVVRASGVNLDWGAAGGAGGAEYLLRAVGAGWNRSFTVLGRGAGARLRFASPSAAGGDVVYTVNLVGQTQVAGTAAAPVGEIASLAVRPTSQPLRAIQVLAQWQDGTLCDSGIFVWAYDPSGQAVAARVGPSTRMGYEVEVDASAASIRVLAKDSWREDTDAPAVSLAGVSLGSPVGVTMPPGGELVILVPDGPPAAVILAGPLGTRVLTVRGSQRLQALRPGLFAARTNSAGVERRAEVEVSSGAVAILDLTR